MVLVVVVVVAIGAALAAAGYFAGRAPSLSLALVGAIAGGIAGFIVGRGDRRAGVPVEVAVTASVVLVALAVAGPFVVRSIAPRRWLGVAALTVAGLTPVAGAAFAFLLVTACPPYVHGRQAGYCSYGSVDQLGGWASGVVALFVIDGFALAMSLALSAWRLRPPSGARRS